MTAPWNPYDFILNGEFADPEFFREAVERVRVATHSTCCVLIVHHAGELFQSLMYVRDEDSNREAELQSRLPGYPLNREDRDCIESCLREGRQDSLSSVLDKLAWRLFDGFVGLFGDLPCRMEVSQLKQRLNATGPNAAKIGVLCIGATEAAPCNLMDELTVAVHASAPVYLHRMGKSQQTKRGPFKKLNSVIREHFEKRATNLAPNGDAAEPLRPSHGLLPLDRFLREVLESVGATHGAVYMIGDSPSMLVPVARLGPAAERYVSYEGKSIEVKKGGGVVSEVKRHGRPIVYNDLPNFQLMVPKIGLIPFSRDASEVSSDLALAVPIIDKSKPDHPVIGVVIAEKSLNYSELWTHRKLTVNTDDRWKRPFTHQDVAFLEEASDRLVAAWIGGWNEALNRIVQSTKRHLRPYKVKRLESNYRLQDTSPIPSLPSDFAAVELMLRDMIVPFCHTVSLIKACTVRVLSVDQSKLVLLLKYPADLGFVPSEVNLTDGNPIAEVVLSGRTRNGPSSELPTPVAGLESYCCLPLFIDSRCIGAVTFASAFPSTSLLSLLSEPLAAATETVAAAIEFAQTQALASILGSTIQLFRTLHEIEKVPGRCASYLNQAEAAVAELPSPREFLDSIKKVREDLSILRDNLGRYVEARSPQAPSIAEHVRPCTIRNLVCELLLIEDAQRYFQVQNETWPDRDALTEDDDQIDARVYEVCLDAMSDLVRNARFEMSVAKTKNGKIYLHKRQLGGRVYGCISLCNPRRQDLPPSLLRCLYREPVRKLTDERLHYGAFLAAWLIRSVGGDSHITFVPNEAFSVTVEIPLLMSNEVAMSL